MHARIVTAETKPDQRDRAVSIYRDNIATAAKQQPGFEGATLLTDPRTGHLVSVTYWASEADMAASEKSGYFQEQLEKMEPTLAGPATTHHLEVSVQL